MMLAATLSLTNCTKEIEKIENETPSIAKGGSFELFAKPAETKTAMDGFNVNWVGGTDNVNVYHAVAGSTTYVSDGEFTISAEDVATGCFKGDLGEDLTEGTNYDWYVFYPYISAKDSPASTTKGYATIGSRKTASSETQSGNNNTEHLAGVNSPLYGKATSVAYGTTPSITMEHLAAFVEFNVTNNSGSALTVSEIVFEAPEDIIGTYYIDFSDPSDIKYVASSASYVNSTVTLNVDGGAEIADKGSAKFYIGIKPLVLTASSVLNITVNGYKKSINLTKDTAFEAGKIKKINLMKKIIIKKI